MPPPRVALPSLRAFLGAIALTATTARTTVRNLRKLAGGMTQNDIDVRAVVNELIDVVEALPAPDVTLLAGTNDRAAYQSLGVFYKLTSTSALETIATIAATGDGESVWIVEADIAIISDDGLEGGAFKVARSFLWDGSSLSAIGALVKVLEQESSGPSTNVDIAASGTNIVVQAGVTADYRVAGTVRYTRINKS